MTSEKEDYRIYDLTEGLKSIAHPVRIEILRLLQENQVNGLSVKQIHERLHLNQPETSRHLIIMKSNGVLHSQKKGVNIFYTINTSSPIAGCIKTILNVS